MKNTPIVVTFLTGLAVGVLGTLFSLPAQETMRATQTPATLRDGQTIQPAGETSVFTDEVFGFSLRYPSELAVTQFDEGQGASTIVFQKPGEEFGFQIFITPYGLDQITQEKINTDLQGAKMENATEILLPGDTRAVHFTSNSPVIGKSSEVWFIRNGYLYEITTYQALDSWLAEILKSLTFIN
jgi:hypothetical protein